MATSREKPRAPKPSLSFEYKVGIPPMKTRVAIAVRKWSGKHEGQYIELLAGSSTRYLEAIGLDAIPAAQHHGDLRANPGARRDGDHH